MMFDIYTQEVKLKDSKGNEFTYELQPLSGEHLPKLYEVMKAFGEKENLNINDIDPKTMGALHELAFITMKQSYPDQDPSVLDVWVSQNLLKLIDSIVRVNMGNTQENSNQ